MQFSQYFQNENNGGIICFEANGVAAATATLTMDQIQASQIKQIGSVPLMNGGLVYAKNLLKFTVTNTQI